MTLKLALLTVLAAFAGSICAQTPDIAIGRDSQNIVSASSHEVGLVADLKTRLIFDIENTGGSTLVIASDPIISGEDNVKVSVDQTTPAQLTPGQDSTFSLWVTAEKKGDYKFDVSIASNDPNENPFTFEVYGNAGDFGIDEISECSTGENSAAGFLVLTLLASLACLRLGRTRHN